MSRVHGFDDPVIRRAARVVLAEAGRDHERRRAERVGKERVGAGVQQDLHHVQVGGAGGEPERGGPLERPAGDVVAPQGRDGVDEPRVDVGARFDQRRREPRAGSSPPPRAAPCGRAGPRRSRPHPRSMR